MPLNSAYGVLIGEITEHYIEEPDSQGRWPHYIIKVQAPEGIYECVINLKSRSQVKIEYKDIRNINRNYFENILQLSDGFHSLSPNSSSGALDVIRHPGLKNYCFWRFPLYWFRKMKCSYNEWWPENGVDVISLMEYYLQNVKRIYIFGEPYDSGLGLHNIHMNQGDPVNSSFSQENGIWQDGGTIIEYDSIKPRISIFLTKFQTQSLRTNDLGRPI